MMERIVPTVWIRNEQEFYDLVKLFSQYGIREIRVNCTRHNIESYIQEIKKFNIWSDLNLQNKLKIILDLPIPYKKMRIFYQSGGAQRYIRKGEVLNIVKKIDIKETIQDYLYVTDYNLFYNMDIGEHFFVGDSELEFIICAKEQNIITIKCERDGIMGYGKYIVSDKFKYCTNYEEEIKKYVNMCNILNGEKVALSFVNSKEDIWSIIKRDDWKRNDQVIAKIETEDGYCNLQSIVSECKNIMIARGDLFLHVGAEKFAKCVFDIIDYCERKQINYYVATGVLESIKESGEMASRAEMMDLYYLLKQKYSKVILTHRVCENVNIAEQVLSLIENTKI